MFNKKLRDNQPSMAGEGCWRLCHRGYTMAGVEWGVCVIPRLYWSNYKLGYNVSMKSMDLKPCLAFYFSLCSYADKHPQCTETL